MRMTWRVLGFMGGGGYGITPSSRLPRRSREGADPRGSVRVFGTHTPGVPQSPSAAAANCLVRRAIEFSAPTLPPASDCHAGRIKTRGAAQTAAPQVLTI